MNPENRIAEIAGGQLEMVSCGWANPTPWNSPRECSDEELGERIRVMLPMLSGSKPALDREAGGTRMTERSQVGDPGTRTPRFALSVWTDARPDPEDGDGLRRYAELLEEARLADRLGFRAFCTTEQHGVDDGYLPAQLTLLAGVAAATSRIRLTTNCLLLPLHPLRAVAEQAVVVDLLSGGRLDLGVAGGGFEREFDLLGMDMGSRAAVMEERLPQLRRALDEGSLPDGPDGGSVPVTPRPAQSSVPILLGGLAPPVVDRAVRLADGVLPYDFERPEEKLPAFWEELVLPALERHGRAREGFRFVACVQLWATEDPERDWERLLRPAAEYQARKYAEWAGRLGDAGYQTPETMRREQVLVDTPEGLARRLVETRARAPWDELVFWYRIPGIGHEEAMAHLERIAGHLIPLLSDRAPNR